MKKKIIKVDKNGNQTEKEIYYIPVRYILAVLITIAETAAVVVIVVALMYILYSSIKDAGVKTAADTKAHRKKLSEMKSQLVEMEEKISNALGKRETVYNFYSFYENRMKSDYDILLEQAKAEMENIRLAEERKNEEREAELNENVWNGNSVCMAIR